MIKVTLSELHDNANGGRAFLWDPNSFKMKDIGTLAAPISHVRMTSTNPWSSSEKPSRRRTTVPGRLFGHRHLLSQMLFRGASVGAPPQQSAPMEPSSVILTWVVALIPEQPSGFAMVVMLPSCRHLSERHMHSQSTAKIALSERRDRILCGGIQLPAHNGGV
jgi:hypothetical protein